MKFEFTTTATVDTEAWRKSNEKLEQDLIEIAAKAVSENEVLAYLDEMVSSLKKVKNENCANMLFLMYDEPSTMPADGRVEYVYKPTYIAATIMMTAMNRFVKVAINDNFNKATAMLLEASLGREFRGAGYDEYVGYMDTLQIFATGDTLEFIEKYPAVNERFVQELKKAVQFLEEEICSGNIRDMWSGESYSARGKEVLAMYQKRGSEKPDYVWYACYGSNICKERFMRYIRRCSDTTPPVGDGNYYFKHNIYFAKEASCWQGCGKAFLDDIRPGKAYGRVYKIKRCQFEEIMAMEGPDYSKKLYLGEIEGWPVYSFTDTQRNYPNRIPSKEYVETIFNGLKECYTDGYDDGELIEYLIGKIFPENTFVAVRAIKNGAHGVTNAEIRKTTRMTYAKVYDAIKWLVENNMIQQDRRSVEAGHRIDSREAFFFTVDSPSARELVAFLTEVVANAYTSFR